MPITTVKAAKASAGYELTPTSSTYSRMRVLLVEDFSDPVRNDGVRVFGNSGLDKVQLASSSINYW